MYEKRKNDFKGTRSITSIAAVLIILGALFLLLNRQPEAVVTGSTTTFVDTIVGGVAGLVGGIVGLIGALVGGVLSLVAAIIAGTLGLVGGIIGIVFGVVGGILGLVFVLVPLVLIVAGAALLIRATR